MRLCLFITIRHKKPSDIIIIESMGKLSFYRYPKGLILIPIKSADCGPGFDMKFQSIIRLRRHPHHTFGLEEAIGKAHLCWLVRGINPVCNYRLAPRKQEKCERKKWADSVVGIREEERKREAKNRTSPAVLDYILLLMRRIY